MTPPPKRGLRSGPELCECEAKGHGLLMHAMTVKVSGTITGTRLHAPANPSHMLIIEAIMIRTKSPGNVVEGRITLYRTLNAKASESVR